MKTEQWIVEKLQNVDPGSYFRVLAAEAEPAVHAMGQPLKRSGHTFVAVGYSAVGDKDPGDLEVAAIAVSNALGDGTYCTWDPKPQFVATRWPPLRVPFGISAFGQAPPRDVLEKTINLIRRYRKRHPERMLGVLQLMVDLIRSTAELYDGVSKDVSVSVLPRTAVPAGEPAGPVASGLILDPIERLTCMFVPDGQAADHAELYMPALVAPGLGGIFGGEIWTKKPPWWTD